MAIIDTVTAPVPTEFGLCTFHVFKTTDGKEHVALVTGDVKQNCLVRIHSECLTGDVFHSFKCDCHVQLNQALELLSKEGGILVYLRQEGRGIGLFNKIRTYALQEQGYDTVEANEILGFAGEERDFTIAAEILQSLGIQRICLLTNNPQKQKALEKSGIVVTRVPLRVNLTRYNQRYLKTKKEKMGHLLPELEDPVEDKND